MNIIDLNPKLSNFQSLTSAVIGLYCIVVTIAFNSNYFINFVNTLLRITQIHTQQFFLLAIEVSLNFYKIFMEF